MKVPITLVNRVNRCFTRFPFRIESVHEKEADSRQMPHAIAIVSTIFGTFWKLWVD